MCHSDFHHSTSVALQIVSLPITHVLCFSAASQQNVKTVTGGVGTIKRKRELRELLEQQDVNYEDDIFDSTPFKKKKDLKVFHFSP